MDIAHGGDGNLAGDRPALEGRLAAGIQPWSSHVGEMGNMAGGRHALEGRLAENASVLEVRRQARAC
jgi:hypothetical protein